MKNVILEASKAQKMKTTSQLREWLDSVRESGWLNKYTVTLSVFFIWMMFFDKHNMIVQYQLRHTKNELVRQIAYDEEKLAAAKSELQTLSTHREKYAREKYGMHKPGEEVFIIVKE